MNFRIIASAAASLVLLGAVVMTPAIAQVGAAPPPAASAPGSHHENELWEWYQGERGHWRQDKENGKWRWHRAKDQDHDHDEDTAKQNGQWEWYQGHPGRWRNEHGGWHFFSQDLVCNNNGTNCRTGREIPANGEGMVSRRNPKWYWHCDSDGHHCDWKKRPGM